MESHVRTDLSVRKPRIPNHEPDSVGHALVEVVEATKHVVSDRIDLAILRAKRTMVRFSLVLVSALVLVAGWITACFALGTLIASRSSSTVALAVMGGFHLIAGAVLLIVAVKHE